MGKPGSGQYHLHLWAKSFVKRMGFTWLAQWVCPICGCERCQEMVWADVNTGQPDGLEPAGLDDFWCPDCEEHNSEVVRRGMWLGEELGMWLLDSLGEGIQGPSNNGRTGVTR